MMNRILIITYEFPPIGGSGVQRVTKFVNYLPKYGWLPFVLTVENSIEHFNDSSLMKDIPKDILIVRTKSNEPHYFRWLRKRSWGRAILRATQFPDIHAPWKRIALVAGKELIQQNQIQCIFSTDPITAHWVAWQLHEQTGLPWMMDIRDLWTLSFTYRPLSYFHGIRDNRLEKQLLSSATAVTCVTKGYKQKLVNTYPNLASAKFDVISNGYDETDYQSIELKKNNCFTLAYSGQLYDFSVRPRPTGWKSWFEPLTHGEGKPEVVRSPRVIFEAVGNFITERPDATKEIQVLFIGSFPREYQDLIAMYQLQDIVKIVGYVNHAQSIQYISNANVLFLIQGGAGSEIVIPGKLYEYLRSGNAILGIFPEGESPQIIHKARSGEVFDPDDKEGIAKQIATWFEFWKQGQPLIHPDWDFIRGFEREKQTKQLALRLNELCD